MDRQRRFLVVLATLAVACAAVQALTGIPELVLYLTPLFLIAALLLSGHYVAEDRIVAAWRARRRPLLRRAPAHQTVTSNGARVTLHVNPDDAPEAGVTTSIRVIKVAVPRGASFSFRSC